MGHLFVAVLPEPNHTPIGQVCQTGQPPTLHSPGGVDTRAARKLEDWRLKRYSYQAYACTGESRGIVCIRWNKYRQEQTEIRTAVRCT